MRKLNRRQALSGLGSISLGAFLAACGDDDPRSTAARTTATTGTTTTPATSRTATGGDLASRFEDAASCSLTPELTEGPYYFDVDAIRSDIREDREGTLLRLGLRVRDAGTCEPIENAIVDIWHCDALGLYSGFESASQGGPGGGRSDDETYLRGAQATNADGIVEFKTVYPGWYRGRTVHIHVKVHLDSSTLLTTQLFTDTAFDEKVFSKAPYSGDPGRDTFNENDGNYADGLELTLSEEDDGVLGLMTFDVQRA